MQCIQFYIYIYIYIYIYCTFDVSHLSHLLIIIIIIIIIITIYSTTRSHLVGYYNTGRFIKLSVITNIYNKKPKGPTLMELFTATGKLEKFFFYNWRSSICEPLVTRHTAIRYSSSCASDLHPIIVIPFGCGMF